MTHLNRRDLRLRAALIMLVLTLGVLPLAMGSSVSGLQRFANGTIADADEVNANFDAIASAVNDNHRRLETIETGLTSGLGVGGPVTATHLEYSAPRTHYYSISAMHFQATDNDMAIHIGGGTGGAYVESGTQGNLVAAVHLPDGAAITNLAVYFNDTSSYNLVVNLTRKGWTTAGAESIAGVLGNANTGLYSLTDDVTGAADAVVDNQNYGYYVRVFTTTTNWGPDLKLMGVVITYTIDEAE